MKKFLLLFATLSFFASSAQIKLFTIVPGKTDIVKDATFAQLDLTQSNAIASRKPSKISVEIPFDGTVLKVELENVDPFHEGFHIDTDMKNNIPYNPGAYYRGKNASLNFFEGEMNGIVSIPGVGNIVIAPSDGKYIIYNDARMTVPSNISCDTPDPDYVPAKKGKYTTQAVAANAKCATMYFEIDYTLFQSNGSNVTATTNWFTSVYNNVQTLFANSGIKVSMKSIYIWTTPDPYTGLNSNAQLSKFRSIRPSFDGDLGQLIASDAGSQGGVADTVMGFCSSMNHAYADVNLAFSGIITYSWTVQVIAHELGHLMGSNHTHACAWNGNNTPLDGCGQVLQYSEGSCPQGPIPSSGSIMSYCYLVSGVGVNFANGFGAQPAARILSSMNSSPCLSTDCVSTCINGVGNLNVSAQTTTSLSVTWTDASSTTSWMVGIFSMSGVGTYTQVNSKSFTKSGLIANTFYKVRIKPVCSPGKSIAHKEFFVATPANWCSGVAITDTGGATGLYTANQSYTRTFTPSAGNKIKLVFSQMATQSGIDIVQIFNGSNTNSLLGTYSGTTIPAAITSSAADGALTLRFYSDASTNMAGYKATVSCVAKSSVPVVPVVPVVPTACSTSTTWNGSSWSSGTPNENVNAIINANLTIGSSFKCCNLTINAGKTLTIPADRYISAVNNVVIKGSLVVHHKGQLIQVADSGINSGTGHFYKTTANLRASDYLYWSSPVENIAINTALTGWGYFRKFNPANFADIQTKNSQGVVTANVPDGMDDNGDSWVLVPTTTIMGKGVGYLSRAMKAGIHTEDFYGKPSNGVIQVPLLNSLNAVNRNFNLVGNPYPSAISANAVIAANTGTTGILYFWTHKTAATSVLPGDVPGSYASTSDFSAYSLTGGVASESGSPAPTNVIASHQAFFVNKTSATSFKFNNAMRSTSLLNNSFLAPGVQDRLWISLNSDRGLYHQMLVGYLPETSPDEEWGYDAEMPDSNLAMGIYSLIDDRAFRIQSRGDFDQTDVVPLGFTVKQAGTYTLKLDEKQGTIEQVFLRDKQTGIEQELSKSYTFTTASGTFKDRFEIIYISDKDPSENEIQPVKIYPNPTRDLINISGEFNRYELYDLYGKVLQSGSENQLSLEKFPSGLYILKLDQGQSFKVIRS